jgi:hypothetical protein
MPRRRQRQPASSTNTQETLCAKPGALLVVLVRSPNRETVQGAEGRPLVVSTVRERSVYAERIACRSERRLRVVELADRQEFDRGDSERLNVGNLFDQSGERVWMRMPEVGDRVNPPTCISGDTVVPSG